jgi:hypothetical protein
MPSITGGDQLDPEYAPHFYIGPNDEYFVWQTRVEAEHEGYLYRAGRTEDEEIVADRRPLKIPKAAGSIALDELFELIPAEELPDGLFENIPSFEGRVEEVNELIRQIQPESEGILEEQLGLD